MTKIKKILGIIMLVLTIVSVGLLSGCFERATGRHLFLNGSVDVEWSDGGIQKCIITFCKQGNYTLDFSPDNFDEQKHFCCGYEYHITNDMIRCCGYEVELIPHPIVGDVEVTVSNGETSECYRFTD